MNTELWFIIIKTEIFDHHKAAKRYLYLIIDFSLNVTIIHPMFSCWITLLYRQKNRNLMVISNSGSLSFHGVFFAVVVPVESLFCCTAGFRCQK